MGAIAGVIGLVIGAGGASALLWPKLQKAQRSQQQLSQDLQRQDQRFSDELDQQGRRHHEQTSQLEAQLATLQAELAATQSARANSELTVQTLQAQVSQERQQVLALQQCTQNLEQRLAKALNEAQIATLKDQLAATQAELASSQLTVQALQAQIGQQRQQVLALQQCTHNLEQRLSQALQASDVEESPATDSEAAIATIAAVTQATADEELITPNSAAVAIEDVLQHVRDRDAGNRANAALALGAIAATSTPAELQQILKALTQLGRDPNAEVRLAVVQSLADLRSPKVIPLLRQALRDADPEVVKAASAAIAPFRGALRQPARKVAKKAKSRSRRSS